MTTEQPKSAPEEPKEGAGDHETPEPNHEPRRHDQAALSGTKLTDLEWAEGGPLRSATGKLLNLVGRMIDSQGIRLTGEDAGVVLTAVKAMESPVVMVEPLGVSASSHTESGPPKARPFPRDVSRASHVNFWRNSEMFRSTLHIEGKHAAEAALFFRAAQHGWLRDSDYMTVVNLGLREVHKQVAEVKAILDHPKAAPPVDNQHPLLDPGNFTAPGGVRLVSPGEVPGGDPSMENVVHRNDATVFTFSGESVVIQVPGSIKSFQPGDPGSIKNGTVFSVPGHGPVTATGPAVQEGDAWVVPVVSPEELQAMKDIRRHPSKVELVTPREVKIKTLVGEEVMLDVPGSDYHGTIGQIAGYFRYEGGLVFRLNFRGARAVVASPLIMRKPGPSLKDAPHFLEGIRLDHEHERMNTYSGEREVLGHLKRAFSVHMDDAGRAQVWDILQVNANAATEHTFQVPDWMAVRHLAEKIASAFGEVGAPNDAEITVSSLAPGRMDPPVQLFQGHPDSLPTDWDAVREMAAKLGANHG
jgi:hypothetical protein